MKKRELALALSILGAVSAVCLRGMKAIGEKIEDRTKKEENDHYKKAER